MGTPTLNELLQAATAEVVEAKDLLLRQPQLNEETRDELLGSVNNAISNLDISITTAMSSIATGVFDRFVSVTGNDETADLTSAKPFRTVGAAINSTPAGMKVAVKLLTAEGHPVFDWGAENVNINGRQIHCWYGGQSVGDLGANASLNFTCVENSLGKLQVQGIYGSGFINISGLTLKSDEIPSDASVQGGWFRNEYLGLFIRLWNVDISCNRIPVFNGSVGNEFNIAIVNSKISKSSEDGRLGHCDWNSSLNFTTAGGFAAEGEIADYFSSGMGNSRVKWNRNYITGNL